MAEPRLKKLVRTKDANASVLYALMAPLLVFAAGAAIDYGRAAQIHSKLNALADAAALAALTPNMLQQDTGVAEAAAVSLFQGLTNGMPDLMGTTVNVTVANGANPLVRNVTVSYATSINTLFGAVIGRNVLPMTGSASASAQSPPNIDFFVLLDNSPSMALPATMAGITQMETLTKKQDGGAGCAFACHQAGTNNGDTEGNPCADDTAPTKNSGLYCDVANHGAQIDNYALARKNSVPLRLDELNSGVSMLLQTASASAQSSQFTTPPHYRFAVYAMDSLWQIGLTRLMALTSDYVSAWTTASASFAVMAMYTNNSDCADAACSSGTAIPGGDVATNYDDSLGKLSQSAYIPDPGNGTDQSGDTPKKVLFIVTDGVEDKQSGGRVQQAINDLGLAPGGHQFGTDWCTTIKDRGIRIAVLYTDYLPVTANAWYNQWIAPIQPDIGPALQACASPGLFYDAAIGSDLGAALAKLFNAVTHSGHLTN
jgi:Flp pilus assembly protein TadG